MRRSCSLSFAGHVFNSLSEKAYIKYGVDKNRGNISDFESNVHLDPSLTSGRYSRSSKNANNRRRSSSGGRSPKRNYNKRKRFSLRGSSKERSGFSRGRLIRNIVIAVVIILAIYFCIDIAVTGDRIHGRVSVGGLNVGGMTVEEAAAAIEDEFGDLVTDNPIVLYASEDIAAAAENAALSSSATDDSDDSTSDDADASADDTDAESEEPFVLSFDYESLQSYADSPPAYSSYLIESSLLSAQLDAQSLAQKAYDVGRSNFFFGRLGDSIFGTNISLEVSMDASSVEALSGILDTALGTIMVNPDITFADGVFSTTSGNDGYMVNREKFISNIEEAFLADADQRSAVIPMEDVYMQVDDEDAQNAAQIAQEAIESPVTLSYEDSTWTLDTDFLGQSISTYIDSNSNLIPYASKDLLEQLIPTLDGMDQIGTPAKDVYFYYDGTDLLYDEAENGIGPDYSHITSRLNSILFGDEELHIQAGEVDDTDLVSTSQETTSSQNTDDTEDVDDTDVEDSTDTEEQTSQTVQEDYTESDAARIVTMSLATSYPTLTYEDAVDLGLTSSLIGSYTTSFSGSSSAKAYNIRLLSDTLTNTVIAPGETFSINEIAGECNEEKGYQEAGAIVNGRVESAIGGGICQVATTIYDAVFTSGYLIEERHNHSTYVSTYEDGMDAAIAWPYLDFKFTNDTSNYLLLLVDYTDDSVTCSLWGIDPGYETYWEMTAWEEGDSYSVETEVDETLDPGDSYIATYGQDGHYVTITRWVYNSDGELIRESNFNSQYRPRTEIVIVGPEVEEESDTEQTEEED